MRPRSPAPPLRILVSLSISLLALAAGAGATLAGVAVPFREDWAGTSIDGWSGGSQYSNPGTGGADGDGFLLVTESFVGHLAARSLGSEYAGDWVAAGVVRVRVALDDVGAPNPFEIHFCVGNASNFWQYNPGFVPPLHVWQVFEVDLSDSGAFTQILGSGTFTEALQHVDRVLLRHDLAPYTQDPDPISGDLGVDRLELLDLQTRVVPASWGSLKAVYRDPDSRR